MRRRRPSNRGGRSQLLGDRGDYMVNNRSMAIMATGEAGGPAARAGDGSMNEDAASPSNTAPDPLVSSSARPANATDREHDRKLVDDILTGSPTAFRELFDRYHQRAFAVALGVVKNRQDALDIVQEAFIKVHKHIHNFQGSSSFYTWLYRIVMNLSIDQVRRTKKRRDLDYDDSVGRDPQQGGDVGALQPGMLDANPGKTVMRKELTTAIERALQTLPEYHRAVILLRELEGLSYDEIADVLDVPKGTVMSRLFHARKKLQSALGPYVDGTLELES